MSIFKMWWNSQQNLISLFLENSTSNIGSPSLTTLKCDSVSYLILMWRTFLDILKQEEGKSYSEYLIMAINQFSFDRELFLDYFSCSREFIKDDELESVRDLYLLKGLRINQTGGEDIPLNNG